MEIDKSTIESGSSDVLPSLDVVITNESKSPYPAEQMLQSIEPFIDQRGNVRDVDVIPELHKFMKANVDKLVCKCLIINILKATESTSILTKFVHEGDCWNLLNTWFKTAKQRRNGPLMLELLTLFAKLPVTIPLLKTNDTAKAIKQLTKIDASPENLSATSQGWGSVTERDEIKSLALEIVTNWKQLIHTAETREKIPTEESVTKVNKPLKANLKSSDKSNQILDREKRAQTASSATIKLPITDKKAGVKKLGPAKSVFQSKFRATGLEPISTPLNNESKPGSGLSKGPQSATLLSAQTHNLHSKLAQKRNSDPVATNSLTQKKSTEAASNLTITPTLPGKTDSLTAPLVLKESRGFIDALLEKETRPSKSVAVINSVSANITPVSGTLPSTLGQPTFRIIRKNSVSTSVSNVKTSDLNSNNNNNTNQQQQHLASKDEKESSFQYNIIKNTDELGDTVNGNRAEHNKSAEAELDPLEDLIAMDMLEKGTDESNIEKHVSDTGAFPPFTAIANLKIDGSPKSILSKRHKPQSNTPGGSKRVSKKSVKWQDAQFNITHYFEYDENERSFFKPIFDGADSPRDADESMNSAELLKIFPPLPPLGSPGGPFDADMDHGLDAEQHHAAFARLKRNDVALERKTLTEAKRKHLAYAGIPLNNMVWGRLKLVQGPEEPVISEHGENSRERKFLSSSMSNADQMEAQQQPTKPPTVIPLTDPSNPTCVVFRNDPPLPCRKGSDNNNVTLPHHPNIINNNYNNNQPAQPIPNQNIQFNNGTPGFNNGFLVHNNNNNYGSIRQNHSQQVYQQPFFNQPVAPYGGTPLNGGIMPMMPNPNNPAMIIPSANNMMNNSNRFMGPVAGGPYMMNQYMYGQTPVNLANNNVYALTNAPPPPPPPAAQPPYLSRLRPSSNPNFALSGKHKLGESPYSKNNKRVCKHFLSSGCRLGDSCSFFHSKEGGAQNNNSTIFTPTTNSKAGNTLANI